MSIAVYKAQEYYSKALVFEKSGVAYYEDGYFLEAIKEFDNARQLHYSSIELLSLQANAYLYSNKYEKAESAYKEILKRDKKNVWAINQLAVLYLKIRKFDDAINVLKNSLQIDPEFTGSLVLLGRAYEEKENFKEAFRNYDFAERQQNNGILSGIAKRAKERVSFKKGFHNSSSWLQGNKIPQLKDAENVFPVVKLSAIKTSGRGESDDPKIVMISMTAEPVYVRMRQNDKPKVSGLPIKAKNGMNVVNLGISRSYDNVNDFPIAPIEYKTIRVNINKDKPAVAQVWPKPLAEVRDPSFLQLQISGIGIMPEDLAGAKFDLFRVNNLKKVIGTVDFKLDNGLVFFKPREPLPKGKYIAYFDPKIQNYDGGAFIKSKTWLFTVN